MPQATNLDTLRRKVIARQGNPAYLSNVESLKERIAQLEAEVAAQQEGTNS